MGLGSSKLSPTCLVLLVACGSTWDLRSGDVLAIGCVEVSTFVDDDDDGWGGPGDLGQIACVTALPAGAAGNDLDCDDADPDVTGFVGRTCPSGLDPEGRVAGQVVGQREFVALDGTAEPVRYTTAVALCEGWAIESSESGLSGQRGLATVQDTGELQALPKWLEGLPGVVPGYAGFVDLRWSEADAGWRWPDGGEPDGLPFCDESPGLEDFLIDLAPTDPQRDALLDQVAEEARLTLTLGDDGWCWGTPGNAGFAPQEALALCERPAPNPVDYPSR